MALFKGSETSSKKNEKDKGSAGFNRDTVYTVAVIGIGVLAAIAVYKYLNTKG